jgi:hypothetical protein
MNRLSIATRISHIYEAGGDTRVVDFMIDGSSIAERVRAITPQQFQYSPEQAPFGNSDGMLVGVTEWRALIDGDLFLTGQHPDFTGPYAGLLPLLVCSDCGMCWCHAIWTRFSISDESVIWDGFGVVHDEVWEPLSESPRFRFDVSHYRDVISAARLAAQITASQP